jgi:hypothetical protein
MGSLRCLLCRTECGVRLPLACMEVTMGNQLNTWKRECMCTTTENVPFVLAVKLQKSCQQPAWQSCPICGLGWLQFPATVCCTVTHLNAPPLPPTKHAVPDSKANPGPRPRPASLPSGAATPTVQAMDQTSPPRLLCCRCQRLRRSHRTQSCLWMAQTGCCPCCFCFCCCPCCCCCCCCACCCWWCCSRCRSKLGA